jgi:hypothetical protein
MSEIKTQNIDDLYEDKPEPETACCSEPAGEVSAKEPVGEVSVASFPSKRISCDLIGDDALQADILVTSLQIAGSKMIKDSALVSLAVKALNKIVSDCSKETGKRFPNEADVLKFLDEAK